MRWMVYGAGAIGGVLGGLLHEAGHDVVLVARGAHLDALRRDGLTLASPAAHPHDRRARRGGRARGRRRGAGPGHRAARGQEPPDAGRRRGPGPRRCPPSTPVVSLQNGVANEPTLLRFFDDVQGVCVMMPTGHLEPGVVEQHCSAGPGHPRRRPLPRRHRRHQRGRGRGVPGRRVRLRAPAGRDGLEAPQADDEPRQRGPGLLRTRTGRRRPGRARRWPRARRRWPRRASRSSASREDRERRGDILRVAPVAGRERGGGSSWQSLRARHGQHRDRLPQRRGGAARPAARRAHPGQRAAPGHRARRMAARRAAGYPARTLGGGPARAARLAPHRAATSRTRKPLRWRAASVGQPCSPSQRCSESAPRFLPTTRTARPSGRQPRQPGQQQRVQRLLADPDRRVGPDLVVGLVGGHVVRASRREAVARRRAPRRSRAASSTRPLVDVHGAHDGPGDRRRERAARSRRSRSRGRGSSGAERRLASRGTAPPCRRRAGPRRRRRTPTSAPARAPTPRRCTGTPLERHRVRVGGEVVVDPSRRPPAGRRPGGCRRRAASPRRRRVADLLQRQPVRAGRRVHAGVAHRRREHLGRPTRRAGGPPRPRPGSRPATRTMWWQNASARTVATASPVASRAQAQLEQRADGGGALALLAERREVVLADAAPAPRAFIASRSSGRGQASTWPARSGSTHAGSSPIR